MKTLILPFVHFATLLAIIAYKARVPFGQFVKSRHQDIVAGLNQAKLKAAEVALKKQEVETKLGALDAERAQISAEWKAREKAQTQLIQETTQRILAQLKLDAELNKKALVEGFKSDAARAIALLVAKRAEEKLRASVTAETQQKMNLHFIKEILGA